MIQAWSGDLDRTRTGHHLTRQGVAVSHRIGVPPLPGAFAPASERYGYEILGRQVSIGAGACWAVAVAACQHTLPYMADAPRGEMMLIGGDESDWLRIFDGYWDTLFKADIYAARMRTAGIVIWFAAVGVVVAGMVLHHRRATAAERAARVRPTATPTAPVPPVADEDMWR